MIQYIIDPEVKRNIHTAGRKVAREFLTLAVKLSGARNWSVTQQHLVNARYEFVDSDTIGAIHIGLTTLLIDPRTNQPVLEDQELYQIRLELLYDQDLVSIYAINIGDEAESTHIKQTFLRAGFMKYITAVDIQDLLQFLVEKLSE